MVAARQSGRGFGILLSTASTGFDQEVPPMIVLVADKFPAAGLAELRSAGAEVLYEPDAKGDALTETVRASGAEVLVVRSTEVPAAALRAGRLGLVVRAGAGYNTIDVATASELGIYVSNCPGKNSIAVAELALALLLALDRRVVDNAADLRRGVWNKKEYGQANGLFGRTLGVVGTGSIGREVAARGRAFGMRVVAWSRSLSDDAAGAMGVERLDTPVAVAAAADAVSIHLALKPETRGLVGGDFFAAMKPGALFVNTSRAEVVDEAALLRAVREKKVRAGLDVFAGEPAGGTGKVESELFAEPGIYGTHHIGASTEQAQQAIADETVRIVREYVGSGRVPNCVNLAKRTPATHLLVVRHRDRVGVLAHVFGSLRAAGINAEQSENIVFDGAQAAMARIQLDQEPQAATLEEIRAGSADILDLKLVEIPPSS
ncbi:MAG TPA: NAD(P)-dependent oxidoreductase [Thermoanaerobaculia bacterium]|jgi:D-3-phosphoglycerate dehydrogenase|nr:NAD(P)-dependent oxidoreductase [Thermoanaerobaculia bacterium]